MSFKENPYQQLSFTDSLSGLTERVRKTLEKSWAKVFADELFPAINEKRFSVLYSDKAIEESVGKECSVITDYCYEQNIQSDSHFLKEHLEQMDRQEVQCIF